MEKAFEICMEMMDQRGYSLDKVDAGNIIMIHNETKEKIIIFICNILKFNIDYIQDYISYMYNSNINNSIIIYSNTITPFVKKIINTTDLNIELFSKDILQYNITKHYLVPFHEALSKSESEKFKKKYGVKFPILLKSDPVCRFYNFKKGSVIRVLRRNGFITYRIVK